MNDTYTIINLLDNPGGRHAAIRYYHDKWGDSGNYSYFHDAIIHPSPVTGLPRFYLLMRGREIAGCCGLVFKEFISRQDLYPWLAGLYVEERDRGQGLGGLLMDHAEGEAKNRGHSQLYCATDLAGYYERYGWERIEDGYEISGKAARIYVKKLQQEGEQR